MADITLGASLAGNSSVEAEGVAAYSIISALSGDTTLNAEAVGLYAALASLAGNSSIEGLPKYTVSLALFGESTLVSSLDLSASTPDPIQYLPSSRTVFSGRMIIDQVDLFSGQVRLAGVGIASLQLKLFLNGSPVAWPLVSGANVPDVRIAAGKVYWTETVPGFYTLRFHPNQLGSWRILLETPSKTQDISLTYDVIQQVAVNPSSGMSTSFIRR